ncbi:response regulator [Eubacterium pyruvativorans]|jgi:two-component system response regulator YcbB|uniref:response regulator n=1 Tax=Eubacterium pyruvativorans TaxID=155865 RepID=UPI00240A8700|nr:response regulator [Eubacterium pyruvativorans]MDD6707179.1 response regulator [Eubacterium pyruvativorans]
MTRFYLLDDDVSVTGILKIIIEGKKLGEVCGMSESPEEAMDDLAYSRPDIVIVDLLMPEMDGITFVKRARQSFRDTEFIMLSQVSSKDMIAKAYEAGVRYFIQKPVNAIEVTKVIENVVDEQRMKRTMDQMKHLFAGAGEPDGSEGADSKEAASGELAARQDARDRARRILQELGMIGAVGYDDIIRVVERYANHEEEMAGLTVKKICEAFSDSPKSMEQRIRRTAASGLTTIASMGADDFTNPVFTDYSGSLFDFEQVRKEMDYIQGKSDQRGNVKIKKFLTALVSMCSH